MTLTTCRRAPRPNWEGALIQEPLQRPESSTPGTHALVAELVRADPNCHKILDIPCGYGALVERFRAEGLDSHGADLRNSVARPGSHFRMADMDRPLPYDDQEFDAVTCVDGIEHIERPFDFIRECNRIIKPGGCLIIATPNVSSLRSRFRWFLTGFHNKAKSPLDEAAPHPSHHRSMVAFHELRYRLHSSGFCISEIRTNRIKAVSWFYAALLPVVYLMTKLTFAREEKNAELRRRNQEILQQMTNLPVLLGESLILKAQRIG